MKKQHEMCCILSRYSLFHYGFDVFSFKCFNLQLDDMEHVFQMTQYPDVTILEALAIRLQLPIEKICVSVQISLRCEYMVIKCLCDGITNTHMEMKN